jgi:hypothetical protein
MSRVELYLILVKDYSEVNLLPDLFLEDVTDHIFGYFAFGLEMLLVGMKNKRVHIFFILGKQRLILLEDGGQEMNAAEGLLIA